MSGVQKQMTETVQKEWICLYEKYEAKLEVGTGVGEHPERPKDSSLVLCLGISTQTDLRST